MNGVSVPLFSGFIKVLVKQCGDKPVPSEMMSRWIESLGDIEREYAALPMPAKPKRKRGKAVASVHAAPEPDHDRPPGDQRG